MGNKVFIRICGKDYAIVGQESDEYIQKVALYIDKKMNEITKNNTKLSTAQTAVLTSINAADDYFKTLEAYTTIENEFSRLNAGSEIVRKENEDLKAEIERNREKMKELEIKIACLETELKSRAE